MLQTQSQGDFSRLSHNVKSAGVPDCSVICPAELDNRRILMIIFWYFSDESHLSNRYVPRMKLRRAK